jgi:hypothetical protein
MHRLIVLQNSAVLDVHTNFPLLFYFIVFCTVTDRSIRHSVSSTVSRIQCTEHGPNIYKDNKP